MCGIVGFVSSLQIEQFPSLTTHHGLAEIIRTFRTAPKLQDWEALDKSTAALAASFDQIMSFATFRDVVIQSSARDALRELAAVLKDTGDYLRNRISEGGSSDLLLHLHESVKDYLWQVQAEVLDLESRVVSLIPEDISNTNVSNLFLGWAVERVLASVDKLEVRGRDSAGISISILLSQGWSPDDRFNAELARRVLIDETETGEALMVEPNHGERVLRVLHKTVNLVGRLGDNGAALRRAIKEDSLLWKAAEALKAVNIMAHTRWASNGLITVANCHPVSGTLATGDGGRRILAVINGDVDNYEQLMRATVRGRGLECNPSVTTDAKIVPALLELETDRNTSSVERLMSALRFCRGSLTAAVQFAGEPDQIVIGQQGSGQALYVGYTADGWLVASEVYGLAATCRSYRALNTGGAVGVVVGLSMKGTTPTFAGRRITGDVWETPEETITISARDLFRGEYDYFIEKEIAEAADSVRKTSAGKYAYHPDGVHFHAAAFGNGALLAQRLRSSDRVPIRKIVVIGHGTASIAGLGISYLLRRALASTRITVEWSKASELFGFTSSARMDDTIIVAVSQSGTTTDTNRIVDIARKRGAWIHGIVNRRSSALVQKSDSYLYTSDGRDVEMSVASTKAYYSQVAAGKVLSLFLASELNSIPPLEIAAELRELESLAPKITEVLKLVPTINDLANTYALKARNWAVVGNGANRVAAEEIRIKLSELCYKAIPCDVTEDKKHIDLSTEPMTIVIANDLPEEVVQDTVKEVAIFKAHSGRPIVICTAGETRFDAVAEYVIRVPEIGGGLAFVLATVVGHSFGVAAAKAIDATAQKVRAARSELTTLSQTPECFSREKAVQVLSSVADLIANGMTDTALSASLSMRVARGLARIESERGNLEPAVVDSMIGLLTEVVEDLSRPIDTIRHQAKTVTVGLSRPQMELSTLIEEVLWRLHLAPASIRDRDREILESISPLINMVKGAVRYEVTPMGEDSRWILRAASAVGGARVEDSRYTEPGEARGTKRTALRTGSLQFTVGSSGDQSVVVVPIWEDDAIKHLLLMNLGLIPQAPSTQLISVLRGVRSRYDELLEGIGEYAPNLSISEVLERFSPRDAIFQDVRSLLHNLA